MHPSPICTLVLGLSVLAAGCGDSGGGSIPPNDVASIKLHLDDVVSRVDAGSCSAVASAVQRVRGEISDLGPEIPVRLARNLDEGTAKLGGAAARDCATVAKEKALADQQDSTPTGPTGPTAQIEPTGPTGATTTPTDTTTTTPTTTPPDTTTTAPTDTTGTTQTDTGGATPAPDPGGAQGDPTTSTPAVGGGAGR